MSFLRVHHGGAPDLTKVEAADLRAYLASRRGDGIGNVSTARELSAVRGFLKFAGGDAAVPRVKGPRVRKSLPRPVSPDEVIALAEDVADIAFIEFAPKQEGRNMTMVLGPTKKKTEAVAEAKAARKAKADAAVQTMDGA